MKVNFNVVLDPDKEEEISTFTVHFRDFWGPFGYARIKELLEINFFDQCRFFRVLPNFVVQFGISGNPRISTTWRTKTISDDPVAMPNKLGTVCFATSGKNTRTTQLFINLNDNAFLDKKGFAPIGEVISGMDVVKSVYSKYRDGPEQFMIQTQGNVFLETEYPKLSYILNTEIIDMRQFDEGLGKEGIIAVLPGYATADFDSLTTVTGVMIICVTVMLLVVFPKTRAKLTSLFPTSSNINENKVT